MDIKSTVIKPKDREEWRETYFKELYEIISYGRIELKEGYQACGLN